jgi:hypothetical protein
LIWVHNAKIIVIDLCKGGFENVLDTWIVHLNSYSTLIFVLINECVVAFLVQLVFIIYAKVYNSNNLYEFVFTLHLFTYICIACIG